MNGAFLQRREAADDCARDKKSGSADERPRDGQVVEEKAA
jgi:hypothetical protein